jgi:D-glycero-D-manno-heptose 1,7-bisphosphate phosphatase
VFVDRDGVIVRTVVREGAPRPPARLSEAELLPGVGEALEMLADRGLLLVVVTNQPDVARGATRREEVEEIHDHLMARLPLRAVLACYHDDDDACECRKPKAGLLRQAAAEHQIDLRRSFMVGDRWSDVEAGRAAGCFTFLLTRPYSQREQCAPDHEVDDLRAAAEAIVGRL